MRYFLSVSTLTLIAAVFWQFASPSQTVEVQPQRPTSTHQRVVPNQQGNDNAPLVVRVVPAPKTKEETIEDANDRAEKLANDRKLIEFTHALVIATYTLGAIGLLQLVVFGYQAIQLKVTVAASAQQMRAYLCVQIGLGIYQERDKNLRFEAKPLLVNTGNTPAYNVRYKARAAILPVPLPDNFEFPLPEKEVGQATVGSQQNATLNAIVDDYCDDADVERIKHAEGEALFVWGTVTYQDIFGNSQHTHFCQYLVWLLNGNVFGFYVPGHNDAS